MDKNHKDRGNCTDMPDPFALIAFGVLRALGKSGIRKNISGEAPVLESTESTEEGWQDGWIRYNGQIYAYNEDIMTFLVMGVDNDDVVKRQKTV
mgnify:CR=1 FL=1